MIAAGIVKVATGSAFVAHGIATGAAVHPVAAAVGASFGASAGVAAADATARRPHALPVDMYLMEDLPTDEDYDC